MKRFLLGFGLLGLVGCFLPCVLGLSWFEMRHLDTGWTVWLVMAAFAIPTFIGSTDGELDRADAIAATASFGYLAYKFNFDTLDLLFHASIGGIMMGVALICGLCASVLGLLATNKR
jgi:hypothetical protein